ncbi:MAG: phosphomevalonate kinase [Archangiaceae bacterium]|nr:phosphomevalonate kinase [Archangiaceae bacterium]
MDRTLSAPGKLFLAGEYAVLWGGVARIAAVGPRTTAMVRQRPDRRVEILLEGSRLYGAMTPAGVNWESAPSVDFHFVARTLDLVLRAVGREGPGFSVALAPSPTAPSGLKLGLGSSARAVVLAAEAARFALDARFDALKLALLAHAEAQNGRGSGGDVAACFAGTLVRYRRYEVKPLLEVAGTGALAARLADAPAVDLYRVPELKVPMVYAFSGSSASTRVMIAEIERRLDVEGRARFTLASDALGRDLEDGLTKGDFAAVDEATSKLQALLAGLGPVVTEGVERLLKLGRSFGCSGKISGAGGGDGCIFFCPDPGARSALLEALVARGVHALAVGLEPGLRGEPLGDATLSRWFT